MKTVRWWCSSANDDAGRKRARSFVPVALLTLGLCGCGHRSGEPAVPPATYDEEAAAGAALPTPAGVPGTAVTGMPTSPPAAAAVDSKPATVPAGSGAPVALPTPVDGSGEPVPATDTKPPADTAPAPIDASAATATVRDYVAALGSGAFGAAQQLWSGAPTDASVLQLARGAGFTVDVGVPVRAADAGQPASIAVPVTVRGTDDDGHDRRLLATYTVRAQPSGELRIVSATVRDAAP